ncbi:acyl-CoA-binding domain-containing protein 4 isoform X2 [Nilaparvata lugens]|uniref:acyl-CoA-binding domain-containing protein 4 isoform X2 n=1 Tax=Nilaparvata lugens TaxID=108931 RepID=UPI00193D8083|nr:acyl-CoA-binding domain-containing protein 4 isoform X2 [Nilaparvata lugens]
MSCERKFKAAVSVIRNLPKNGSYQPSHDLMLRFYAYYKQATEGPNTSPKPNFWEVVKKMKWDAWSKLGNMSREQAMVSYVEELNKIVETMAYTDNVANFLTSLDSFYDSVPAEDLELVMGPVIERVRSQPGSPLSGSPLASREASPQRSGTKPTKHITSSLETSPASSYSVSPTLPDTDEEEEYFVDTYELTESENLKESASLKKKNHENVHKALNGSAIVTTADNRERERSRLREKNNVNSKTKGNSESQTNGISSNCEHSVESNGVIAISNHTDAVLPVTNTLIDLRNNALHNVNINEVVQKTLSSLKSDIECLNLKITAVEMKSRQVSSEAAVPFWWPFRGISVPSAVFLIVWPLIVQALFMWLQMRRRRALPRIQP